MTRKTNLMIVAAAIVITVLGCGEPSIDVAQDSLTRIHRGEKSSHPFVGHVVEYIGDRHGGSGSVVFPRCVLTAAHVADADLDWFCLGSEPFAESNPRCARVARRVNFSDSEYRCDNDLAFLKLAPFDDGDKSNIRAGDYDLVPIGFTRPPAASSVRVIGYGAEGFQGEDGYRGHGVQREGSMNISEWFSPVHEDAPRCIRAEPDAGTAEGNMALPGDSGGAVLSSSGELIGVTHSYNEGLKFNEFVSTASEERWLREKLASFCHPQVNLTLTAGAGGWITGASRPIELLQHEQNEPYLCGQGGSCQSSRSFDFVSLEARSKDGYRFDYWQSADGGDCPCENDRHNAYCSFSPELDLEKDSWSAGCRAVFAEDELYAAEESVVADARISP